MGFVSSVVSPPEKNQLSYWFAFQNDNLMVKVEDNRAKVPKVYDLDDLNIQPVCEHYLGTLNGEHCYAVELPPGMLWPENMSFMGLRELFVLMDEDIFKVAVNAVQVVAWGQTHQFCGRCGAKTETKPDERAKVCPQCNHHSFPRITPAIMVGILKENQILLAANRMFPPDFYSVLAGFMEPGETLEECIVREVREEVGVEVKNIKYFGSQPWPFPNSLMIAFTADYAGGDIVVDGNEIVKAGWYSADNLPKRPTGGISVASKLIDWFKENH